MASRDTAEHARWPAGLRLCGFSLLVCSSSSACPANKRQHLASPLPAHKSACLSRAQTQHKLACKRSCANGLPHKRALAFCGRNSLITIACARGTAAAVYRRGPLLTLEACSACCTQRRANFIAFCNRAQIVTKALQGVTL